MQTESYKYLMIGGGAAGTSAAETVRENDPDGSIMIVSDEIHPLYSRVMLSKPNFFLGKIPFEQIWMKSMDWYEKNKIIFRGGKIAVNLDTENKIVTLNDGQKIKYEKLLIATGVRPRKWNVPGADKKGIFSLRTLEDGQAIMEKIKTATKAVVVGGGFIGFEMADLMHLAGLETTMILREDYFWQPTLDEASGQMIEKALAGVGVKILKNSEIAEICGQENAEGVILKDGSKIDCDIIIVGIGVEAANLGWVENAGVETCHSTSAKTNSASGRSISANEFLETNIADIWTAGDIAEYKDLLLEEKIQLGNWVNAHEQGRIAGLNMTGKKTPFKFVSFYTTTGVGTSVAFVGDARLLPDRLVIQRGSPKMNSYCRILIVGKELVGATMINRISEMSTISKIIENNIDVSDRHGELADINFDLKKLLEEKQTS